ncbi:MAG: glycosyltransferase family 4 protein [Gammaproteobacteria bacterium]|nr:glycosyltransferase family 4 protein [Gammaproteobacteria bacterium]NNC58034.1 glycosyltransferase family 4 protein [Woeseiaceae bacterium]NNL50009.1 glycosyltransferase family 4 protein [Woeseiaceae bacterium]
MKIDLVTYGEGTDPDIPNLRIFRGPRLAWLGRVKTGPSLLKLFLDVFVAARTVGRLLRNRYDFVDAHEEAVFFCRFLKPIFRFKLIYDMHSSLPQQLTNFDFTDSRIIRYIFEKLENSSINAADAVITICPDIANYATQIITDPAKHFLIENSIFEPVKLKVDDEPSEGQPSSTGTFELPTDRFCFVYAGTLETYQGIDLLVRSFANVVRQQPRAFLLVVGGTDAQVEHYRSLARAEGLEEHCHFTGTVPQRQAHQYMQSASTLLSPRTAGTNTPLKVYQQLASGIPQVATNIYSHTQVLNDDVAFLADPDPDAFGASMLAAMSDGAAKEKAENAKRLYEREYSRELYVGKLGTLLNALFSDD